MATSNQQGEVGSLTNPDLEFRLLGPLEFVRAGTPIQVGQGRERSLLALLLLHANRVVSSDALVDRLWGEDPPASAAHALQVHVSNLRKILEPDRPKGVAAAILATQKPGYLIRVAPTQLDAARFEELAAEGRDLMLTDRLAAASKTLADALGLWRGPALADVADESWARVEIDRLEEMRLAVLEDRIEADLAVGAHGSLVGELDALARANPLRERIWSQLMLALYRSGRQAEALRAYDTLRETLRDELGIDPSPAVRARHESMLQQAAELDGAQRTTPAPEARPAVTAVEAHPPIDEAPPIDEQRVVTALFADLTGSTSLGEQLDPEEYKILVDQAVSRMIAAAETYGGTVVNVAGDGILALFGAPTTHEDDPERALRAALDIVSDVAAYGNEVADAWGVEPLTASVGVHTGSVVFGAVAGQTELTAMGDTINTAARIESAAPGGSALIGESTRRIVEPLFEFGDPLVLDLKGKQEPVHASPLVASRSVRGKVRGLEGVEVPVVGRERELGAAVDRFEQVLRGTGGVLLVSGDAGLGKSRLLAELRERFDDAVMEGRPKLWLEGRSLSYGERLAYAPITELLRDWLGTPAGEPQLRVQVRLRSRLEPLFGANDLGIQPFLANLLGVPLDREASALVASLSPQDLRASTFDAVAGLLSRLATEGPVVVALDDLHWADGDTLDLVDRLLVVTESAAVLLVLALRPERSHASWGLRESALRVVPHRTTDVALQPLTGADADELLDALVGANTLTLDLKAELLDAAEGNPFYLEELVRALLAAGALVRETDGAWRLDGKAPVELPPTIEKVIQTRIDGLPRADRDLLTMLSVLGRQFDIDLARAIGESDADIEAQLARLLRAEMLREAQRWPRLEYRFKHSLIQDTAYRSLVPSRRNELHLRAGLALEARSSAQVPESNGLLAHHFQEAGDPSKAFAYHRLAVLDARATHARESAMSHSDAAIAASEQLASDDPALLERVAEVYFWQGQLHRQRGMLADAEPPLRRALTLARDACVTHLELDVLTELGFIEISAGGREQATRFQEGLSVAEQADDAGSQATMLARLAIELVSRLELDEALALGERALELARVAQDEMAVARSLDGLKLAQLAVGDLAAFRVTIAELEEILRRHDDLYFLQYALLEHGTEASASGRWDDATKLFDEALTLNRRIKNNVDEALMLAMHANALRGHGDYETALRSAHEAFRISEHLSHRLWLAWASVSLGLVLEELGDDEGALEVFARVTTDDASLAPRAQLLPALAHTALGQLRAGAIEAGTASLARADQMLARATCPPGRVFLLASDAQVAMARAHLVLGDADRAVALLDPLIAAAESAAWHEAHALAALALGEVRRVDDADRARSVLEQALAVATTNELLGLEWRVRVVLGGIAADHASPTEADLHREHAQALVTRLADRVPDEIMRRRFIDRAAAQIAAGRLS